MTTPDGNSGRTLTVGCSDLPGEASGPETIYRVRTKMVRGVKGSPAEKLQRLIDYLTGVSDQEFTGYIKINYTQGSIGRVDRFEEILRK